MTSEFLNKKELVVFVKELKHWSKPENFPPEFQSNNPQPNVNLFTDIWSMGTLVQELTSIGSLANPPKSYSKKLIELQEMMKRPQPQKRPTPDQILNYIAEKSSPIKEISTKTNKVPEALIATEQSDIKYYKNNVNRELVELAVSNIDSESDCSVIMKLVKRAWGEPEKIGEFYTYLQQKNVTPNITVMLKTCVAIQYYFLCGPQEVMQPSGNPNLPLNILTMLCNNWVNGYKSVLRQTPEVTI